MSIVLAGWTLLAAAETRVLDDFHDLAAWHVGATDDVQAALHPGPDGRGLCIDYDFGRVSGYVTARRELPIEFPARYEMTLDVRGDAPNTLQFKLVDAGGDNVWWRPLPDFHWPSDWQALKLRQRQIAYAWGPTADRTLRRSAAVEIVIVSGHGAPRGTACVDRLVLRELPAEAPPLPTPVIAADALGVDFGVPREFGALALRWQPGRAATRYRIELSDDGMAWRHVREVDRARGESQVHFLPDSEARFVRVVPADASGAALAAVEPRDAADANAYFADLATHAPRGRYPRGFSGEQAYWTVFGVDGGRVASLLGEDGAVEPLPGIGALEPMLVEDGKVLTWADAETRHTLEGGDLPMPAVHWRVAGLALDVLAFARGTPGASQGVVRYRLRNAGPRARTVALALAWRPFQVNPPTQFLANPGGASELTDLAWNGMALSVNGTARVLPLTPPASVRLEPLAAGPVGDWVAEPVPGDRPRRIVDPAGFPSAVLHYDLRLAPGESREIAALLPLEGKTPMSLDPPVEERRVARHWRERLDRVAISGSAEVDGLALSVRASLGQILVNRSGPALQPGPRAYARSWIRDGALTSAALLRLGQDDVARDFLNWYAPFQFASGKVPCCATDRGADPVPENDSDGEFIFATADLWRHTHDAATARALWPNVRAAAAHMEALRQSQRIAANRVPGRRAYFGLMPPSISHEGYSDKPAYSYWDDFWAATGWRSAVELAKGLGMADDARALAGQRDEFKADLLASLDQSTRRHGLDLLPGSADRGDVDPTSSTVALSPAGLLGALPEPLVRRTFERYWANFVARRDGAVPWAAYTPYEWRNVGALVRLGERTRALAVVDFLNRDRRPAGWNQWAEVVSHDPRAPRFVGDMPHGWVASDHIRAVLDLFAYEDEGAQRLVLAAGVPLRWLDGPALRVRDLRTPYGRLSWSARSHREGGRRVVDFTVQPLAGAPPGGIELQGPWPVDAQVRVDGRRVAGPADVIRLQTPAKVRIAWADDRLGHTRPP